MSITPTRKTLRLAWVDNLRVAAITGVIIVHTATAYLTDFADWFYDDELEPSGVGFAVFAVPALLGGIFGLGPLFWLAGWFSVPSLRRRGPLRFALTRLVRLGLPLAVFVALVNPAADFLGDIRHRSRSFAAYAAETEFSVMWFVAALIFCSLVYAGIRTLVPGTPRPRHHEGREAAIAAATIAASALLLWPTTSLLDEHLMSVRLGAWPQGVVLFALGVLAAERSPGPGWRDVDPRVDRRSERRWGLLTVLGVVATIALIALGTADSDLEDLFHEMPAEGIAFALVYGLVSVSFTLWCLGWFRRRWTGRRNWSELAGRASYATYVLHPVVLTGVMVACWWMPLGPELKFLLVVAVGVPACFLAGHAFSRVPGVRRVLRAV
jgi:peptidoglycan/LPS O-acetylase OafA/YrhL